MFVDKDLESKIKDDLRLALVSDQPLWFQLLVAYEIAFS